MTRCRLESPGRVNQPMILISQIEPSGGTLLSRLFDAHPACFAHPYELSWGRSENWHRPKSSAAMAMSKRPSVSSTRSGSVASPGKAVTRKARSKKGKYPFVFDYSGTHDRTDRGDCRRSAWRGARVDANRPLLPTSADAPILGFQAGPLPTRRRGPASSSNAGRACAVLRKARSILDPSRRKAIVVRYCDAWHVSGLIGCKVLPATVPARIIALGART